MPKIARNFQNDILKTIIDSAGGWVGEEIAACATDDVIDDVIELTEEAAFLDSEAGGSGQ